MKTLRGFTLIEVLIAVFLLAMIGALVAQVVSGFVRTQGIIHEASERSRSFNTTLNLFKSDAQNMVARVTMYKGSPSSPFYADSINPLADYEFVRFSVNYRDGNDPDKIHTGMVAWGRDDDGRLFRDFWPYANRANDELKKRRILLENVSTAKVISWPKSIRSTGETLDNFVASAKPGESIDMPQAIELIFNMDDGRKYRVLTATADNFGEFIE